MTVNDPNFGHVPHKMPNYRFTCPRCGKPILISQSLPILPEPPYITEYELTCQTPPCDWHGVLRGSEAVPWPPPAEEKV